MDSQQDILSQLCCVNCQKVSQSPNVTSCCNSVVCLDCKPTFQINSCQVCGSRSYSIQVNSFLSKISSQIKMPCKYSCGFSDNLIQLENHELDCKLKKYECNLCGFTSHSDEFICHINSSHQKELIQSFSKGEQNKKPTSLDMDPTKIQVNKKNFVSRVGETGKYYCGQDIGFRCGCCSGCGPHNGDNCLPCMILDVQTRKLPKGYLVNKFGAISILKDQQFSCGRLIGRKRCGENYYWCDGCDSLMRNAKNYKEAFSQ
ncbi:hypothetical protein ABPG74_018570 [Tetrahymena malaccensis]